ncbi:WD40-repeat-containing domain [Pseudocohnilembus persalinus]|uniref:WD40-repeat-containing domain n=1 Tax=Pseudocohnilembus persalinus TaxID=266149 RepID=A0A0V0Q9G6_PSEPJ|nr:WD40-repeat-containing domain [Pseudocohnilembus persalinus]|eukprot:KRW98817.1 WD40-repeat-containing domain [Pseudocohnilembus persalinus]
MDIFQKQQFSPLGNKPTSIDYYKQILYLGDDKGNVHRYEIDLETRQVKGQSNTLSFGKGKVELIKIIPYSKHLLVIHEGALYYIHGESLEKIKLIAKKNVVTAELNQDPERQNEFLYIDKKDKKITVCQFEKKYPFNFIEQPQQHKSSSLPYQPAMAQFYGKQIYIVFPKREYQCISSTDFKEIVSLSDIQKGNTHLIYVISKDEILFSSSDQFGVFFNSQGKPAEKTTLQLIPNQQVLFVQIIKPYLILGYEKCIKVYNLENSQEIQDIQIDVKNPIKCMTATGDKIFYGIDGELMYLYQQPYQELILKNLNKGKLDDAISIFNSNHNKYDDFREQKLQELYMDAFWSFVTLIRWTDAKNVIIQQQLPIDLREIIYLFKELLPSKHRDQVDKRNKLNTIDMVIQNQLNIIYQGKQTMVQQEFPKYKKQAEEFLAEILENRRIQYTQQQDINMKEKIEFSHSKQSLYDFKQIEQSIILEELLELIDFVLIKIYIKIDNKKSLKDLFKRGELMCKNLYGELQTEITSKYTNQENYQIVAQFQESFGKTIDALEVWSQIDSNKSIVDENLIQEACKNTIRILTNVTEKKIIEKYYRWVLKRNLDIAFKLLPAIPENVINPNQVLDYFENKVFTDDSEKQQRKQVRQKYLEVLVHQKKDESSYFHNELGKCYIEELLKYEKIPKEDLKKEQQEKKDQSQKDFYNFLQLPTAKYNPEILLEKIKGSWLFKEQIFLLGKLKRHQDAISTLVERNEFLWAEKYCEEKNEKLLTNLFDYYIQKFQKALLGVKQDKENSGKYEKPLQFFKQKTYDLMKKYATHSQLDQVEVLDKIPADVLLSETGEDSSLYSFISSTLSHTLHQKRTYQSAKNLSEMDLLNAEYHLVKAKQAYIKINTEKKCRVCTNPITNKVFVVYPNGVAAHYTCVQKDLSICPKTGQDFQKTFKGF